MGHGTEVFHLARVGISICNRMGPRAIKDSFHVYSPSFIQNWENFENTSEINPLFHESTCDYLFIA